MSFIRLPVLLLCLAIPDVARAAEGSVHLYLQPLPSEAARLSFTLLSVSAVTADGAEHPLTLKLTAIRQADASRQRLLASGRLPAGSYGGFLFGVGKAALGDDRREAALSLPDAPARLDFPFVVSGRQSPLVWLTLRYSESVSGALGFAPVFSAATPALPLAGRAGFVSNTRSNTITVFDKRLAQAVAAIDTCAAPTGMALDQHRRRLYVACATGDEIQSIDVASGEIVERTRMSPGDRPREVVLTPDGLTLVSVNTGSNSITFFDAVTLARHERLGVGSGPTSVVIDPSGQRAFVFNTLSSSVSIVDMAARSVAAVLSTESAPVRGHFNRRGDRLYVTHDRSPYLTVLDPRQLTVVTRARLSAGVTAIAIDTIRDLLCVGGRDTAIEFYDPHTLLPLYSMRTKAGAAYLAIDPEANSLYIVSPETQSVAVARLADRKIGWEIDVGEGPYWVAVVGEK